MTGQRGRGALPVQPFHVGGPCLSAPNSVQRSHKRRILLPPDVLQFDEEDVRAPPDLRVKTSGRVGGGHTPPDLCMCVGRWWGRGGAWDVAAREAW